MGEASPADNRGLLELSSQVTGEDDDLELTPGEVAVLADVIGHPVGSISEIHQRTGFVQSQVSASVSRLKAPGLVMTETDPGDGRRTRVRVADGTMEAIIGRAARGIDQAIGRATSDPAQARRATELLEELADILL